MPEKRNISRDSKTDRCIQRANGLLILAYNLKRITNVLCATKLTEALHHT